MSIIYPLDDQQIGTQFMLITNSGHEVTIAPLDDLSNTIMRFTPKASVDKKYFTYFLSITPTNRTDTIDMAVPPLYGDMTDPPNGAYKIMQGVGSGVNVFYEHHHSVFLKPEVDIYAGKVPVKYWVPKDVNSVILIYAWDKEEENPYAEPICEVTMSPGAVDTELEFDNLYSSPCVEYATSDTLPMGQYQMRMGDESSCIFGYYSNNRGGRLNLLWTWRDGMVVENRTPLWVYSGPDRGMFTLDIFNYTPDDKQTIADSFFSRAKQVIFTRPFHLVDGNRMSYQAELSNGNGVVEHEATIHFQTKAVYFEHLKVERNRTNDPIEYRVTCSSHTAAGVGPFSDGRYRMYASIVSEHKEYARPITFVKVMEENRKNRSQLICKFKIPRNTYVENNVQNIVGLQVVVAGWKYGVRVQNTAYVSVNTPAFVRSMEGTSDDSDKDAAAWTLAPAMGTAAVVGAAAGYLTTSSKKA